MKSHLLKITFTALLSFGSLFGQSFELDENSILTTTEVTQNYSGAAWVDFDNDGDLDLSTTPNFLFENDGNGNFTLINTEIGSNQNNNFAHGFSWADFDNDGDLDVALAGNPTSIFRNRGNGTFELFESGDLRTSRGLRTWSSAWGDYDNDGYVDLIFTHPAGFLGSSTPSFFFKNKGAGFLSEIDTFQFTSELAPYTIATWSDYDLDGDQDLFIGSGPANGSGARDYLYTNLLTETGSAQLRRIDSEPVGTELQDGQTWNWIDFDNDRDLDGFVTNYGGATNHFYINNGGEYESISNSLTLAGQYLSNNWGDFDNDGDLDVVLSGDSNNKMFINNGDGTFTELTGIVPSGGGMIGITLGDYDDDGDLDFYASGGSYGLYNNITENSNNWVKFDLEGTISNKAAIGAMVEIKSTISGNETWQIREVSAQNGFNSHNSLIVHFGLGDASVIDSVIINWPSGQTTEMTDVTVNTTHSITEELPANTLRANFSASEILGSNTESLEVDFTDLTIASNNVTAWEWDFNNDGTVDSEEQNPSFTFEGEGTYDVKLTVSDGSNSDTLLIEKYIEILGLLPDISISKMFEVLGAVAADEGELVDTITVYNSGDGSDSILVDLNYIGFDEETGVALSNDKFFIAAKDSAELLVTFNPAMIQPVNRNLTVSVIFSSKKSVGINSFKVDYRFRITPITSVDDDGMPREFALFQNYPNPFNPSTQIGYSVPKSSFVTIKLYDILGNEVKTLVNEYKSPGNYTFNFDAASVRAGLASGLYLYKMTAGNFIRTNKMMLLK